MKIKPSFNTSYVHVKPLKQKHLLVQECLQDHTLNMESLYWQACKHKHNHVVGSNDQDAQTRKRECKIDYQPYCSTHGMENKLLIPVEVLMYHPNFNIKKLKTCIKANSGDDISCQHTHFPPCNNCELCRTGQKCMFNEPFVCQYTDSDYCSIHSRFTLDTPNNSLFQYHKYLTKDPKLYYCSYHSHLHRNQIVCNVHSKSCCPKARLLHECDHGFVLNADSKSYTIYNPMYWENLATAHFQSLIRAVITNPKSIAMRYKKYEESKFKIGKIKEYKSGKNSIIRQKVTGFSTNGSYQIGIISNTGHPRYLILPQELYDLLEKDYDLDLAVVKRDPAFYVTSTHVVKILRNDNPLIKTIILANELAKPMNQDQDGDNDTVFFLPKRKRGFDFTHTAEYKIAKLELALAFLKSLSLLARPRISLSECDVVLLERGHSELWQDEFYQEIKRNKTTYRELLELGISIRQKEFNSLYQKINHINSLPTITCLTIDDVLLKTNFLPSIVQSGAKGTEQHLEMLLKNLFTCPDFDQLKEKMIRQYKLYITSSRNLGLNGRSQFSSLYAIHDLIILNGILCLNKTILADYKTSGIMFTYMYPKAALDQTLKDLELL
jgi:hypothetical protein